MKKGMEFLIFFSLNFIKTFLAPRQASLANLLFFFPGLGALRGVDRLSSSHFSP